MALYYYKNINLSRINLKKSLWGKEMYITVYIRKIQATHGAKRKRYIYNKIPLEIYYIPIYKKNTTNPPGGK